MERRAKDVTLLEFRLPRVLIRGAEISIVFYFLVLCVGVFSGLDSVVMLPVVVCCCCCCCCCSLGSEGSKWGRGSVGGGS